MRPSGPWVAAPVLAALWAFGAPLAASAQPGKPGAASPAPASTAPAASGPAGSAPSPVPAGTEAPASGAVTPSEASAPAAPVASPASTAPAAPDTRGAAMRAYQRALAKQKLGNTGPLSEQRLLERVAAAEVKIASGRRDEAIADLVDVVESERFEPFRNLDAGRNAVFLLGDALGRAGAREPARAYLGRLLAVRPLDVWARRAAKSLVDLALEADRPDAVLADLEKLTPSAPPELGSDIAYLAGRTAQKMGRYDDALRQLALVAPRSRFWAQATYLSGLIRVEQRRLRDAEREFCKIADVKRTPRAALAFGGGDFFEVRDLARLGLGRVAHEQYRFDDSRYYYYLVPTDSEHLPEALYESANSRYEAKDYKGARDLLDEMRSRGDPSPYDDEVWVFDAYVDLALCQFPSADEKLRQFLLEYEPVRNAARRVAADDRALADLVESVRTGADPSSLGTRGEGEALRRLGTTLRGDVDFGRTARRVAELDQEASGLRQSMAALDDARARLSSAKEVRPRVEGAVAGSAEERSARLDSQLAEVRRLLRNVKASGEHAAEVRQLEAQLAELEARARAAGAVAPAANSTDSGSGDLVSLVGADRGRATSLHGEADRLRADLVASELEAGKSALTRLDRRLSRLLRRARLGRIETVLGKKRALEVEIEALSEGFLPQGAVDSLEAARYLKDDEEYWPFDGEDWADEYVGGEGLR